MSLVFPLPRGIRHIHKRDSGPDFITGQRGKQKNFQNMQQLAAKTTLYRRNAFQNGSSA